MDAVTDQNAIRLLSAFRGEIVKPERHWQEIHGPRKQAFRSASAGHTMHLAGAGIVTNREHSRACYLRCAHGIYVRVESPVDLPAPDHRATQGHGLDVRGTARFEIYTDAGTGEPRRRLTLFATYAAAIWHGQNRKPEPEPVGGEFAGELIEDDAGAFRLRVAGYSLPIIIPQAFWPEPTDFGQPAVCRGELHTHDGRPILIASAFYGGSGRAPEPAISIERTVSPAVPAVTAHFETGL